ncbi:hypothetical protein JYQ29_10810 [Curtobacterium flaccumfaciens pv. flaccumfaciens]|uniref:DUF6414 family protein n=1 Tax=Curtobacterium flaccumfaciens TaxID=2035 RepID=UPI001ADCA623|nr:hypothetical protein [Curtobacterium flaccumfaciens]MBO9057474.1 hypothetical protein [Curtobacterium flaccumfaciens pv. flaccumfaciens]
MTDKPKTGAPYFLAHPIYLDENMMLSFLAHLDGGFSSDAEEQEEAASSSTSGGSVRAGIRAKLLQFASAELSAEGKTESTDTGRTQVRRARHHTAASLFNLLYQYLHEDNALHEVHSKDDLASLQSGSLVEFEAAYAGNPLEEVVRLMGAFMQTQESAAQQPAQPKASAKSGSPARKAAAAAVQAQMKDATAAPAAENSAGEAVVRQMVADIDNVPVHDLLLELDSETQAVVVADSEYFTNATNEILRSGRVKVLGKVTLILSGDETINLTRRTILGAGGPELAAKTVLGVSEAMPGLKVTTPIVEAPAIQVIPMAIFV